MQQVYYTQCPIGYGLGATSGFQIKRLDPGYPVVGDLRHLGLRAFLPGSRTLAPPALRYRRDGDTAEIAWLTPRSHEYETEGGRLWGRPGGQFAHGLRLDASELATLDDWPAGLYDRPFWVRTDPERTQGHPPRSLAIGRADLLVPPAFGEVVPMGRELDPDLLARLLTALASVTAEGRCLTVIAEASRLGPLAALLTFAFPPPFRAELTFSTYHDRPEELSGFRLQGTIPEARPNRMLLAPLGILADLTIGSLEPKVKPARWAKRLAGWIQDGRRESVAAWERTAGRVRRARVPSSIAERWSSTWLDALFAFDEQTRPPAPVPSRPEGWRELIALTRWSAQAGLAEEWAAARGPTWWRAAMSSPDRTVEARAALVAHARLPHAWREPWHGPGVADEMRNSVSAASGWGDAAALGFAPSGLDEQVEAASRMLRAAPIELRGAFLASLIRGLTPESGGEVLKRLSDDSEFDPDLLRPVQAARDTALLVTTGEAQPLADTLHAAFARKKSTASTLAAVAEAAGGRTELVEVIASMLAERMEDQEAPGWDPAWRWALGRADSVAWLGPYLRRVFAHPDQVGLWDALLDRTLNPFRPALARVLLEAARADDMPPEPFLWGIDRVLLPLEPAKRPHHVSWADACVARLSSLDLLRRLYLADSRDTRLTRWLAEAGRRGEFSTVQATRIRVARDFAEVLQSREVARLRSTRFPDVPARERGDLLRLMLGNLSGGRFADVLEILAAVGEAWGSAAFAPAAEGLAGLGEALAIVLADHVDAPRQWLSSLEDMLKSLGIDGREGFAPDGLAAEVVASACGPGDGPFDVWPIRSLVFRLDHAWRSLAVAARRDLPDGDREALSAGLRRWNQRIVRGHAGLESRFHELILNAAWRSGPWSLRAVVLANASELRTLDRTLSWWAFADEEDAARDDLRDGFARLVPVTPIPAEPFLAVRDWLVRASPDARLELDLLEEDRSSAWSTRSEPGTRHPDFSDLGWARWRCVEALTVVSRSGLTPEGRWNSVMSWIETRLPLDRLSMNDRHRFVAELIRIFEGFEPDDPRHERPLSRLGRWLVESGVMNLARLRDWPRDLAQPDATTRDLARARRTLVTRLVQAVEDERGTARAGTKAVVSPSADATGDEES